MGRENHSVALAKQFYRKRELEKSIIFEFEAQDLYLIFRIFEDGQALTVFKYSLTFFSIRAAMSALSAALTNFSPTMCS